MVTHSAIASQDHLLSNHICSVGGGVWFCVTHTLYFFTGSYTRHYSSILHNFVVMEQRVFGIGVHSLFG